MPQLRSAARLLHVLLAARQPLERLGIRALLGRTPAVGEVTEAPTPADAEAALYLSKPSMAVVDLDPREEDPVDFVRAISNRDPGRHIPVLALGDREDEKLVKTLLELGVRGFLLKDRVSADLPEAVESIAAGGAVFPPMATRWLIDWIYECSVTAPAPHPQLPHLTPRELDVLRLVAQGMSNAQIARSLVLGVSTVKSHLYHVMKKLGIGDRAKAVALAYQCGLVTPPHDSPHPKPWIDPGALVARAS
jgi:DNA-binding NarL/FixJ family response regulator